MKIQILEGIEGAKSARGLTVVIDVFRAFSVACVAMENGVGAYYAVGAEETARTLATEKNAILVGERNAIPLSGFDYGNSPSALENANLAGLSFVHTTSAGTQGLLAAADADEIITGAFVNAGAIAEYIRRSNHHLVSLVALGTAGVERSMEDTMCAMYIKNEVEEYPNSFDALKQYLASIPSAEKFFDPEKDYAPERDFELCMDLSHYDFVLKATPYRDDVVQLTKIDM